MVKGQGQLHLYHTCNEITYVRQSPRCASSIAQILLIPIPIVPSVFCCCLFIWKFSMIFARALHFAAANICLHRSFFYSAICPSPPRWIHNTQTQSCKMIKNNTGKKVLSLSKNTVETWCSWHELSRNWYRLCMRKFTPLPHPFLQICLRPIETEKQIIEENASNVFFRRSQKTTTKIDFQNFRFVNKLLVALFFSPSILLRLYAVFFFIFDCQDMLEMNPCKAKEKKFFPTKIHNEKNAGNCEAGKCKWK